VHVDPTAGFGVCVAFHKAPTTAAKTTTSVIGLYSV